MSDYIAKTVAHETYTDQLLYPRHQEVSVMKINSFFMTVLNKTNFLHS